jgi:sucrose-6F-phosphate phosphohydrolase
LQVDHADHESKSLLRFGALWQAEYNHDSLLVFSTGRSPTLYFELRSEVPLLTPGIAIMSVGTEIMYGDTMTPDYGWVEELSQGWDRSAVVEVANEMQLKYQVCFSTLFTGVFMLCFTGIKECSILLYLVN